MGNVDVVKLLRELRLKESLSYLIRSMGSFLGSKERNHV